MNIQSILDLKGKTVLTLRPEDTVETAATLLSSNNIGAMPVRDMHGNLIGILSERDIVHGLSKFGAKGVSRQVGDLMTTNVLTCTPQDEVKDVLDTMSSRRVRHLPVVADGELIGMVSQGDVVKSRLQQSQMETDVLREYAIARG